MSEHCQTKFYGKVKITFIEDENPLVLKFKVATLPEDHFTESCPNSGNNVQWTKEANLYFTHNSGTIANDTGSSAILEGVEGATVPMVEIDDGKLAVYLTFYNPHAHNPINSDKIVFWDDEEERDIATVTIQFADPNGILGSNYADGFALDETSSGGIGMMETLDIGSGDKLRASWNAFRGKVTSSRDLSSSTFGEGEHKVKKKPDDDQEHANTGGDSNE